MSALPPPCPGQGDAQTIVSIQPPMGQTEGGYPLTISGSAFTSPTAITVGGKACVLLSWTTRQLVCRVPEGVGSNLPLHIDWGIRKTTPAVTFGYLPPTVKEVNPPSGPTSGGPPAITIQGTFTRGPMVLPRGTT
jgi:hypothetical protein